MTAPRAPLSSSTSILLAAAVLLGAGCELDPAAGLVDAGEPSEVAAPAADPIGFTGATAAAVEPMWDDTDGDGGAPALLEVDPVGDRRFVVLDAYDGTLDLADRRPIRLAARTKDEFVMQRALAPGALADEQRAWIGAVVTTYAVDGAPCSTRATAVSVVGWFDHVNHDQRPSVGDAWDASVSRGGAYVVAELERGRCADAVLAERREHARGVWPLGAPTPALEALVRQQLPLLSTSAANQAAFLDWKRGNADERGASWDRGATVTIKQVDTGTRRYLTAEVQVEGFCGDWAAGVYAVWELQLDRGAAHLVLRHETDSGSTPDLFTDADGDGALDAVYLGDAEVPTDEEFDGCGC